MTSIPDAFSALPEFSAQDELLRLEPVARTVESNVPNPVAQVIVDLPQLHLDRVFDYEVPEEYADIEVGVRVRVELGGRTVDGFVIGRCCETLIGSPLRPIKRVVSPVPVLTPAILALARAVSARQSAPVANSLRLAIPQRHARAERKLLDTDTPVQKTAPADYADQQTPMDSVKWRNYAGGVATLNHLAQGRAISGVVQLRAIDTFIDLLIPAVEATLRSGKTAVVVVPTERAARKVSAEVARALSIPVATFLSHDSHPQRYTEFLRALTGRARVVVGTRHSAWAPVTNLGALFLFDDQHAAFAEPRSPYIHTRDLLSLRAAQENAAFLTFNYGPSVYMAQRVQDGGAYILPVLGQSRASTPQVFSAASFAYEGSALSRLPSSVFTVVRAGLERGHVLIVVPKAGYIPAVACAHCRAMATCSQCNGPLSISRPDAPARCDRCGASEQAFICRECSHTVLRPVRIGSARTAQEIGRAMRGVPIYLAGAITGEISNEEHGIVVATPGAEPGVEGGYAAAVILDAGYMLRSTSIDSESYFLRALAHVAARVRPRADQGQLLIVGDVPAELVAVAQKWEFGKWSTQALEERAELALSPAAVWIQVTGDQRSLREFISITRGFAKEAGITPDNTLVHVLGLGVQSLVPGMEVIGPTPNKNGDYVLYLRFDRVRREELTALVDRAHREASARRVDPLRVKVGVSI
ncbi:MAG: hypothetical protein GX483_00830 [Actinomycetaceae bacterium]|nr:hypothetical protein [Actinomycetaceae bacterium]